MDLSGRLDDQSMLVSFFLTEGSQILGEPAKLRGCHGNPVEYEWKT
jgi:hypothetical protein